MNLVQITFAITSVSFVVYFHLTGSTIWTEDTFSYSRLIFLMTALLHLSTFTLLPSRSPTPPLYPVYKAVLGIIFADMLLMSVWNHLEHLVQLLLLAITNTTQYEITSAHPGVMLVLSLYFLLWTINTTVVDYLREAQLI